MMVKFNDNQKTFGKWFAYTALTGLVVSALALLTGGNAIFLGIGIGILFFALGVIFGMTAVKFLENVSLPAPKPAAKRPKNGKGKKV